MYDIEFKFDGGIRDEQGNYVPDPPHVYITKDGCQYLEVFEDPTPAEDPPNENTEWTAGPFAQSILELLQENM